ncbi:MAG: Sec-independent protein translocase subunit TatA [Jatrophihabitantaceae bacterium]
MFTGADAPWHWLILVIVVVALFGYKKLPDAARSLGRSMRVFKTEIKGMSEDDKAREAAKTVDSAPVAAVSPPLPPVAAPVAAAPVAAVPQPVAPAQPVAAQPVAAQPVVGQPVVAPAPNGTVPVVGDSQQPAAHAD